MCQGQGWRETWLSVGFLFLLLGSPEMTPWMMPVRIRLPLPEAVCAQQLETEEDASVGWRALKTGEAGSSLQGDTFGTGC